MLIHVYMQHTYRANMINIRIIESFSGNAIVVVPLTVFYQLFYMFEIWHNQKVHKKQIGQRY